MEGIEEVEYTGTTKGADFRVNHPRILHWRDARDRNHYKEGKTRIMRMMFSTVEECQMPRNDSRQEGSCPPVLRFG